MKTISLENLAQLEGGGTVGNIINGACTAGAGWSLAAYVGLVAAIAVPTGVGQAAAAICFGNAIGTGFGWW